VAIGDSNSCLLLLPTTGQLPAAAFNCWQIPTTVNSF